MPKLIDACRLVDCLPVLAEDKQISLFGAIADFVVLISEQPTIEADPVRHGYWENANGRPKTYIRKCSVCGKEAYFCGRGCSYKFCPNCGAKMDLEESDG